MYKVCSFVMMPPDDSAPFSRTVLEELKHSDEVERWVWDRIAEGCVLYLYEWEMVPRGAGVDCVLNGRARMWCFNDNDLLLKIGNMSEAIQINLLGAQLHN